MSDDPPDWRSLTLPSPAILARLTDAHCHPTDTSLAAEAYDAVRLGGLAAMATVPEDQGKVASLALGRPWRLASISGEGPERSVGGPSRRPRVVACFGYHPWFAHRYALQEGSKEDHYRSIFNLHRTSTSKNAILLGQLLPYLPDPMPFDALLQELRQDLRTSLDRGSLTMLGEVGLDGAARLRWPKDAQHLDPSVPNSPASTSGLTESANDQPGASGSRLTPFKTSMAHQRAVLDAQLDLAVAVGVNISVHSVAAPGHTLDALMRLKKVHGARFAAINVDLHSGGGWSPEFWAQAEVRELLFLSRLILPTPRLAIQTDRPSLTKQRALPNLYASPSIAITARSPAAASLIRAISRDRMLVESDSADVRHSTRLVWGATEWIARCKGWALEDTDADEGDEGSEWVVRVLERNWERFMRLKPP